MKKHAKKVLGIVLSGCMLFCMLFPVAAVAEEYSYDQLSPKDMDALQEAYFDTVRYHFEQRFLPPLTLLNADVGQDILTRDEELKALVHSAWDQLIMVSIIGIQQNSEDVYAFPAEIDNEALMEAYMALVEKSGFKASDVFDASFEALEGNNVMLLLSFHKADTALACKYIGIAAKDDGTVRYLTAETNDMFDETHPVYGSSVVFCEVMLGGRGNMGLIDNGKEAFVAAVNGLL